MSTPNWAKLVAEGRAKAVGIQWDGDVDTPGTEVYARYVLQIPAEYIRTGVLTAEDYKKAREADEKKGKPLERKTRKELVEDAEALGVEAPEVAPDIQIREAIRGKKNKK